MKQLNIITSVGLFPLPLNKSLKSLPKAKARAEFIAHNGVWIQNVFLAPTIIRMIEVVDVEPKTEASEGTGIEPAPAPSFHEEDQPLCKQD